MKIKESVVGDFSVSVLVEDKIKGDWWFTGVYEPMKRGF